MINERLTKAISVPDQYEFQLKDGRKLMLTGWNPVVEAGGRIRVNASFLVLNKHGQAIPVNKEEGKFELPPEKNNYAVDVPMPTVRVEFVDAK